MARAFDIIFVPIDFSVNTDTALEKALALCANQGCIHLYHMQKANHSLKEYILTKLFGVGVSRMYNARMHFTTKLDTLSQWINTRRPDICVYSWFDFGKPIEKSIIQKALFVSADLIIVGKTNASFKGGMFCNVLSSRVSDLTGLPVLTVKADAQKVPVKTVVLTVGLKYPAEKVELLSALQTNGRLKIRLVSFKRTYIGLRPSQTSLLQAMRRLRQVTPFPIEYDVLTGTDKTRALLRYCQNVSANVLIVPSGLDLPANTWFSRFLSDMLPPDCVTEILSVKTL